MTNDVDLTGYHLTFDAEMTTSADMALFTNTYANGDRTIYPNDEAEYYADYNPSLQTNPFSFSSGALMVNATPTPQAGLPYTSGMLDTANTFSQNQGYFEIRAKVPDGSGFWTGFWLLAQNYSAEIDILEQPNNDGDTNYYNSVKTASLNYGLFQGTGTDLGAGYHSYGFMWTASTVQFTFDGAYIGYAEATPAQLATMKLYILANLAVGGANSWPGAPNAGASGQLSIDYIRAFSDDPTVAGVAQEAISSPDGVDTTPDLLPMLPTAGTGSDKLVLQVSEDAYQGDAQCTVSVDGKQVGGVYTVSASKTFLQTQDLTINGNFGPGSHTVKVNFLNDLYGGSTTTDRNLYVTQASLDGSIIQNSALSLPSNGPQSFTFLGASTVLYQPTVVLGSGPDILALQLAEDAYNGDAQFTISVDGTQVGGVQTATALYNAGATQAFDILGNFAPDVSHTVSINFLNDAYGGSTTLDRNLYVTQASIDNTSIVSGHLSEYVGGAQSFTFQKAPDTLTLGVSEDAYQGDAQYEVLVDGNYVDGTYTATASHAAGQVNMQTITGNWGEGPHTIGIQFLNDAYGGSPSLDRNLYINSVNYDGSQVSSVLTEQGGDGTSTFAVPNTDTLTLHLAEDAYNGDAQFTLSVDGQVIDQPTAVTASHAADGSEAFSFTNMLTAGTHDIGITFLNDAYGGSYGLDRNLYVVGADLNGSALSPSSWVAPLYTNGTAHFSLVVPS